MFVFGSLIFSKDNNRVSNFVMHILHLVHGDDNNFVFASKFLP